MAEDNQSDQTNPPLDTALEGLANPSEIQEATLRHIGGLTVGHELITPDVTSGVEVNQAAGLGLLSAEEYRARRSDILLKDPEAVLNEEQEIHRYFDVQDPAYLKEIRQLSDLDHPMKPTNRLVVAIPAYNEGSRIRRTLEQYVGQDIDPNLFEIIVFANPVPDDKTPSEIAKFKQEHPGVTVTFAQKSWREGEPNTVGNARKHSFDIAMTRLVERGPNGQDTILISNDADTVALEKNYLSSILAEFDVNPKVDALVTRLNLPREARAKPNVEAAVALWDMLDRTIAKDEVGDPEDRIPEPVSFIGRSNATRASIYAAAGGYNPKTAGSEDLEMGWMISDARDWDASRIIQFDDTVLTSDPRRNLVAAANRVPISEMYSDFQQNPEIRQMNNDEVLAVIPDALDWEHFQADADSFWRSQDVGMYKRLGQRFAPLFKSAMDKLGVQYEIVEGSLVLTNVDALLKNLAGAGKPIEVIHSQPRIIDPNAEHEIRQFFSEIPRGVLGAWAAKADRIAGQIKLAQDKSESDKVSSLIKRYEHFAGHTYPEPAAV